MLLLFKRLMFFICIIEIEQNQSQILKSAINGIGGLLQIHLFLGHWRVRCVVVSIAIPIGTYLQRQS